MTKHEFLRAMQDKSERLTHVLGDYGYSRGDGIRLVNHLAAVAGVLTWCQTRTPADYDRLISLVHDHEREKSIASC